jgi:light-regulated signal transduction histidine kinase (bacteriophytochrome)
MDTQFLEAVLHDLKGPVSRCRMLGDLLARQTTGLGEEARTLVKHIGASAVAAESVLEAVRRYAEAVALTFQPKRFHLETAVARAVERLDQRLRATGGEVTYTALPEVEGDAGQLGWLFEELIGNALRFRSEEQPRIQITAEPREPESQWWISVRDNGIGLRVLEPDYLFRPLGKSADRPRPAVGLAICRRIAKLHGGNITAVARPRGAEFFLCLPF